jgi:hypothetical protein
MELRLAVVQPETYPARPWRTKPGIFKQWIRPELYRGYDAGAGR